MITTMDDYQSIDILVIGDNSEALALRAVLEGFDMHVRLHFIGNVQHFLSLLSSKYYLYPLVIISCHGVDSHMIIPQLAPDLEAKMPCHDHLTPDDLKRFVDLDGQIIINTGCSLGTQAMADVFFECGANAYMGANDYIDAKAMMMFIINFFYSYKVHNRSLQQAIIQAQNVDDDCKMVKLWLR